MDLLDTVIIGAGPAGLSAALFADGDELNFKIVEKGKISGFVEEVINTNFTNLENYLGLYGITGSQVAHKFRNHLTQRNIEIDSLEVMDIIEEENKFVVITNKEDLYAKTLILATGTSPLKLDIIGSNTLSEHIHYGFSKSLGEKYSGCEVLVVGGRNSGLVTAIRLKEEGCYPTIIERSSISSAKNKYIKRVEELKIPYLLDTSINEVFGSKSINTVSIIQKSNNENLFPTAIFSCIGYYPNSSLAKKLGLELDGGGYVKVERTMRTTNERIFAAGDVNGGVKMISVASGEGAIAEYYVNKYIKLMENQNEIIK